MQLRAPSTTIHQQRRGSASATSPSGNSAAVDQKGREVGKTTTRLALYDRQFQALYGPPGLYPHQRQSLERMLKGTA